MISSTIKTNDKPIVIKQTNKYTKEQLSKLTTQRLLNLYRKERKQSYQYFCWCGSGELLWECAVDAGNLENYKDLKVEYKALQNYLKIFKDLLATRENI